MGEKTPFIIWWGFLTYGVLKKTPWGLHGVFHGVFFYHIFSHGGGNLKAEYKKNYLKMFLFLFHKCF